MDELDEGNISAGARETKQILEGGAKLCHTQTTRLSSIHWDWILLTNTDTNTDTDTYTDTHTDSDTDPNTDTKIILGQSLVSIPE